MSRQQGCGAPQLTRLLMLALAAAVSGGGSLARAQEDPFSESLQSESSAPGVPTSSGQPAKAPAAAMSAAAARPASKPKPTAAAAQPTGMQPTAAAAVAPAPASGAQVVATQPELATLPAQLAAATPAAAVTQTQDSESRQPAEPASPPVQAVQAQAQAQTVAPRTLRNLVVPQFVAPPKSRVRAAVLRTLADHAEVEVVSIDDVTFASHRLQADSNTPEGRAKLSRELGIDAWLDGRVDLTTAHLTLTAGDGAVLQEVDVESEEENVLDALTGERMWAALGPRLSSQEAYRRAVLAEYDRARNKFEARIAASERQIKLAHEARAHRAFVLRGQFSLAQRKQAALTAALTHQTELGHIELARQAEQARQIELARQAEAARKLELAQQAKATRKAELARVREEKAAALKARADAKKAAKDGAKEKAAERAERALAKRTKSKAALGTARLTNSSDQKAQAKARAKNKKKRGASTKPSSAERLSQGHAPRSSRAAASKDKDAPGEAQLLSKQ